MPTTDVAHEPMHHSDYFLASNIERWAAWVDARLGANRRSPVHARRGATRPQAEGAGA